MKEVKLLGRVQAVLHLIIHLILATIQELGLKSELTHLIHTNNTQQLAAKLVMQF